MAFAALIISLVALGLQVEMRVRQYLQRRRAVKALGDAMRTMAAIDSARSQLRMSVLSAPSGDFFPKGRN